MFKKIMPKNRSVRHILFACITIGILVPLINLFFIYPAVTKKILIKNTEGDAMRMAMILSPMFKQEYAELTKDSAPPDLIEKVKMFQNDFQFIKLTLFSKNGEIIYSSDSKDIGKTDDNPYFHEIIATGDPYSKTIKKDTISLEGKAVTADIVATCVPIMRANTFVGAFEIYSDITLRNQALNKILLKASVLPFLMMLGGFAFTVAILIHLDKNITRQKETEQELQLFTEKLKHSNRELESFAHIASHDLQEPLRKVIAFGELLETEYDDKLDETGCDYLRRMRSASIRMQTLINDLLTFSRITTKAQPFVSVNLNTIVKEVSYDLESLIERTGGKIETVNLITIDADQMQMRQLFQNIIGNALKFYKEDVPPIVKISGNLTHENIGDTGKEVSDNDYFQITFEDNGIGFEEQYADRIFAVFQRLHGRKEYEGTGIGLSICQRITNRHNGKIIAKSSPGKGTSFIVTLPVKQKNGGNNG